MTKGEQDFKDWMDRRNGFEMIFFFAWENKNFFTIRKSQLIWHHK